MNHVMNRTAVRTVAAGVAAASVLLAGGCGGGSDLRSLAAGATGECTDGSTTGTFSVNDAATVVDFEGFNPQFDSAPRPGRVTLDLQEPNLTVERVEGSGGVFGQKIVVSELKVEGDQVTYGPFEAGGSEVRLRANLDDIRSGTFDVTISRGSDESVVNCSVER